MTGTTSNNDLCVASVTYYNAEKQFGFAEGSGQRIFFHMSACREVEGTPEEPRLTNTPMPGCEPAWWKGCRWPDRIVVKTVSGPKGLKAAAWGYLPKRTWVESLRHFGTLNNYTDGHVEIRYSRRHLGRPHRESRGKLTAAPQLALDDQWTLRLSYDAYDSVTREYGECTGHKDLVFQMADASPCKMLPYGRYALNVYLTDTDEWARIVFCPHGQWIGD